MSVNSSMMVGVGLCILAVFSYTLATNLRTPRFTHIKALALGGTLLLLYGMMQLPVMQRATSLVTSSSTNASQASDVRESNVDRIEQEALDECGIPNGQKKYDFPYPIIPISGYRKCLQKRGNRTHVAYIGEQKHRCDGCIAIDPTASFTHQSELACASTHLVCGTGASFLCGVLAFSTKTPVNVSGDVLMTWPAYMQDYNYKTSHHGATLELNHRLAFDRHTIQTVHPLLQSPYRNMRHSNQGFNVFQWDCDLKADKTKPIPHGNMGDIFGSYLGAYLAQRYDKELYVHCTNSKAPLSFPASIAFVGSIVNFALKNPRTILLGVGTIEDSAKLEENYMKNVQVLGVRGPKTRDQFIQQHGINPAIVGDPGIFLYPVFKELIDATRQSALQWNDLCFISHYVDGKEFKELLPEYQNVTINAFGTMTKILTQLATCRHTVTSSLHGAVFSHSLSIPTLVIQMSDEVYGGEHKFFDYYYGINVTNFHGRYKKSQGLPNSTAAWIDLINQFPQPTFPVYPALDTSLIDQVFQAVLSTR